MYVMGFTCTSHTFVNIVYVIKPAMFDPRDRLPRASNAPTSTSKRASICHREISSDSSAFLICGGGFFFDVTIFDRIDATLVHFFIVLVKANTVSAG